MSARQTPSQTIGPYFAYGLTAEQYHYAFDQIAGANLLDPFPGVDGERIRIIGHLLDGNRAPVTDAMIEIWQADGHGRYAHPADHRGTNSGFTGFGRTGTGTDPGHHYVFDTIKPASVDGRQAPHINLCIFARGLLNHLYTRLYFSDEQAANAVDPVLALVPESRRDTLIAKRDATSGGVIYRLDIVLQGAGETVFLDL